MTTWGVVAIVAIVMGCTLEMVRTRSKGLNAKERRAMEEKLDALAQQNAKLAQRIEVLETIVTDSGFELDKEIRKLG